MVKIRLKRLGKKKKPFYRIVVSDVRAPRNGRFIEEIGTLDPLTDPRTLKVNKEKVDEWIKKGALPTDTVKKIFVKEGILES